MVVKLAFTFELSCNISHQWRLSGQVLDQLWSIGAKFGLIRSHCVSGRSSLLLKIDSWVLCHRTVIKSSGKISYEPSFDSSGLPSCTKRFCGCIVAILIKDINHGKDDGDHGDIDVECDLAICQRQVASGKVMSSRLSTSMHQP